MLRIIIVTVVRLPGLVDPHVHLREPGATHKEDFESGTRAALAGGFVAVCAMPNTTPPLIDADALTLAEDAAALQAVCDYGIHLGGSAVNVATCASLADRIIGLKLYLDATFGTLKLDDIGVIRALFAAWDRNRPILCHAEDRSLAAVLLCAHLEDRSVHICHVSRRSEIELIRAAKARGVAVTCEVAPHHLFLSTDDIPRLGAGRAEVRPRLATPDDVAALWANMDVIDCIATDHAPHLLSEKDSATPPPGFPGLETALPLMLRAVHDGRLDLTDLIERMAAAPRSIFDLPAFPDTYIDVDVDADWTVRGDAMQTRAKWTPFEGWRLRGRVERVVLRGKTIYENGIVLAQPGSGLNLAPKYQKDNQ
ncbi:MAG: amidohydrolase family protein [Chloroflexota bacterium]|nr:amidohydrolase family protein [Chloroflexota bacterium]